MVDISFSNDARIVRLLRKVTKWNRIFETSIKDLEKDKDYTERFEISNNRLLYLCEFFKDAKETEYTLKTIRNYIDKDGNVPDSAARRLLQSTQEEEGVIVPKLNKQIQVTPKKSPSKTEVEAGENVGITLNSVSIAGVLAGGVVSILLMFLGIGYVGVFLRFFQLWKFFDRLELINVNFGPVLSGFLSKIDSMVVVEEDNLDEYRKQGSATRGQLSENGVGLFALQAIPNQIGVYLGNWVIWIVYLALANKREHYEERVEKKTRLRNLFVRVVPLLHVFVFGVLVQDLLLYTSNEILHHYGTLDTKDENVVSLAFSWFVFFLVWLDLAILGY